MKRTPLKRKSTRVRMRGPKPKKQKTSYARRERDTPYMLWVKTLPCLFVNAQDHEAVQRCHGPIHAHHAGEHGLGQKPPDDTCVPLCEHHHLNGIHGRSMGMWNAMTNGERITWSKAAIAWTRERYATRLEAHPFPNVPRPLPTSTSFEVIAIGTRTAIIPRAELPRAIARFTTRDKDRR